MTTNVPGTRAVPPANEPVMEKPTSVPLPVSNPTGTSGSTGASGVAVYDRGADESLKSSANPSVAVFDSAPPQSRSSGMIVAWVIGIVVLIIVAYFLLQFLF